MHNTAASQARSLKIASRCSFVRKFSGHHSKLKLVMNLIRVLHLNQILGRSYFSLPQKCDLFNLVTVSLQTVIGMRMVEWEADRMARWEVHNNLGDDKNMGAPVLRPCVASGNANATGLDQESENNHILSQYEDKRASCRSRLKGRTMLTA